MKEEYYCVFCSSPFEPGKVDEDYEDQFVAAKESGFQTILFDFDVLRQENSFSNAGKRIKASEHMLKAVYRGWMLTPVQYEVLYNGLLAKNYRLINTPGEYQNCHYLPDSLKYIENHTPLTVFEKFSDENSLGRFIEKTQVFGQEAIILKDYVKSEKHDWETACYVANASDTKKLEESIQNLLKLRGADLNEGIVARKFIELENLVIHSKSGMPLTEEYRLFFCNKHCMGMYDYWEEGDYSSSKPDTALFEQIAQQVESHFFTMDIARKKDGEWVIIELGDGQVAGLPDKTNRNEFYDRLKTYF